MLLDAESNSVGDRNDRVYYERANHNIPSDLCWELRMNNFVSIPKVAWVYLRHKLAFSFITMVKTRVDLSVGGSSELAKYT